jgi:peptidoglycan-associated lipoprotein
MKQANIFILLTALALVAGTGCKPRAKSITDLGPGQTVVGSGNEGPGGAIPPNLRGGRVPLGGGTGDVPLGSTPTDLGVRPPPGSAENPETLAAQTIYFDFDKSAIKGGERSKLESVGAYLKNNPAASLKIEGHCDERGTEEYNRALGERRAIAARDFLVQAQGIDSSRITTVSFGEDKPADPGKDEGAYAKNRRDQFVVLQIQ